MADSHAGTGCDDRPDAAERTLTRSDSKVIRSSPVLPETTMLASIWQVKFHSLATAIGALVFVLSMVAMGMPLWTGEDAAGHAVSVSAFSVTACPSPSSKPSACETASAFGPGPASYPEGIATQPGAAGVAGGILLLITAGLAACFAVMAGIRAKDEAILGRGCDCCELRAKFIIPAIGAVTAAAGVAAGIAVTALGPAETTVASAMGGGAALSVVNGVLMGCAAVAVGTANKEIQWVRYQHRIAAEEARRRSKRWSLRSSGTAAVLAAATSAARSEAPFPAPSGGIGGSNPLLQRHH